MVRSAGSTSLASPTPITLPARLRTTAIHLPSTPFAIAASNTDVWLASSGRVLRVDQARDKVVASVAVPGLDDQDSISVGGSVWATVGGRHEVVEIDPKTNRVSTSLHIPGFPVQIAADQGSVWVISATNGSGVLRRIDPTNNVVTLRMRLSAAPRFGLSVWDGSLWLDESGDLLRVNPDGTRSRVSGAGGSPLAIGDGSVWEGTGSGVARIDPTTGDVVARFPTPQPPIGLAFASGSLWVLTDTGSTSRTLYLPDRKHPSTVLRIDPSTNRIDARPAAVGIAPAWLAAAGEAWVADFNGATLVKIQSAG
jgi:DNA-binding beta-propeller fold protein YncE